MKASNKKENSSSIVNKKNEKEQYKLIENNETTVGTSLDVKWNRKERKKGWIQKSTLTYLRR